MQVTPAGLEVIEEASTTYEFLVSEAPSQKNLKTDYRNIILEMSLQVSVKPSKKGARICDYSTRRSRFSSI